MPPNNICRDALPFCYLSLRVVRCPIGPYFTEKKGYPTSPKTIGEMIRKRRLDLGLRQLDVANIICCDEMSVVNWEKNHTAPRVNHLAAIVRFLGFNPFQDGDTMHSDWSTTARRSASPKRTSLAKSKSIKAPWRGGSAENGFRQESMQSRWKLPLPGNAVEKDLGCCRFH
jgi:transcriptional regulator with XRE-family HTH domain